MYLSSTKPSERGFALVELLITIAIIGIVTGLMLVRYGAFNSTVLLKNQAYKIALDLREAQAFAVSARDASGSSEFREEYGIHFNTAQSDRYIFFQDNGTLFPARYDSGEAIGGPILLDRRFVISQICVNDLTPPNCTGGTPAWLSVTFARPNFDAKLRASNGVVSSAFVTIRSISDPTFTRSIIISPTGQIAVQ